MVYHAGLPARPEENAQVLSDGCRGFYFSPSYMAVRRNKFVVMGLSATRRSSPCTFWSGWFRWDPDTVSDISSTIERSGVCGSFILLPFG